MTPSRRFGAEKHLLLAERQLRRWDLQKRAGASPKSRPCVAVSRLPGAGGAEVGRRVAELLDYGFFGREIVEEIARELHVDYWLVAGLDERVRSGIDRWVDDLLRRGRVTENDYLHRVTRIIATLGRRGSAVIVGRGAPFVLSPREALRVLIVAPRSQRLERYAELRGVSADRVEESLDRAEEHRRDFAERQFHARQEDPSLYDLVLNTGTLSFEDAATLIVQALRCRFPA